MSPEYLEHLADIADPEQLWRLSGLDQHKLPTEKRRQLDMGVALRRQASHVRELRSLLGSGRSLLISPIGHSARATKTVSMPEDHARLIRPGFLDQIDAARAEVAQWPEWMKQEASAPGWMGSHATDL